MLYPTSEKEADSSDPEGAVALFCRSKKVSTVLDICSLTYRTFSNFLTGQCMEAVILGTMFFISMSILRMPYALLIGVLIAFTALIPIFGAFIGCVIGTFLILMVNPMQAIGFIVLFLVLQQVEGNSDLSARCWRICRPSFHVGACCSQSWRKSDGTCRNADLYPDGFCDLYIVQRICV